jgi:putative ABC transport system permease protein
VRTPGALLREAAASARSQPVATLLTVAMVAGMCIAVLLTTGRTVAAERAVLAQIDAAGTRSIVVRAADPGVTAGLLDRLETVAGIEAVSGFGPIVDARNSAIPGGPKVPVRRAYGAFGEPQLGARSGPAGRAGGEVALASAAGARALGLRDGTGGLVTDHGLDLVVAGSLQVPRHLRFLEPLVVIPSSTTHPPAGEDSGDQLAVLVVLAGSPPEVAAVEAVVRSFLDPVEPASVTVETSTELAAIRAAVGGELGSHGRATVLGILAISAVLVAVNLLALVTMRRRDFGRRRALGATQPLIIALLVTQVFQLAVTGAAVGTTAAVVGLAATGSPLPGRDFTLAVAVAGVLTAVLATLPPATVAARRDPLHELRIP